MSHKNVELPEAIKKGWNQVSHKGRARLGIIQTTNGEKNADNVFVLVAHYDFKGGAGTWPRRGNDEDVENLRKTFGENRNCRFRDLQSPTKEVLFALLAAEQKLKRFFSSEDAEPSVFIFIILSHGGSEGKIYTDTKIGPGPNDYDSFNTKQFFANLEKTFQKSLRLIFLGPCRCELTIGDANPTGNQNEAKNYSSKVSFEPKMYNTIIFCSTVETTSASRDFNKGTWLVQCLCDQLNLMIENESIAHFSTGMQNRIHEWAIKAQPSFLTGKPTEQTMETKIFPLDRNFTFSAVENCGEAADFRSGRSQSTLDFDWMNPQTKSRFRGKLAAIFHDGIQENAAIKKLEFNLIENLGFETKKIKLHPDIVQHYFQDLQGKSWSDYGCFAAFFFAHVTEEENQVCVNLSGNNEPVPIGELIHSLLGPESQEWRGKPKLFFLIDVGTATEDASGKAPSQPKIEVLQATRHSGWMLFILRNKHLLLKLLKIFESKEIKGERSLQECLGDLLIQSKEQREQIIPRAMFVSTLPHFLHFPQNFVKPNFKVKIQESEEKKHVNFAKLIEKAMKEEQIWLLSSLPGTGKSTVMIEIALELRRRLCGVKVFNISLLQDVRSLLSNKKFSPSLVTVISLATRVDEKEIEILIKEKRIILMFDGFDEICPFRRDAVLNLLLKAVEREIPVWISTRPHEEDAITKKLGGQKICTATILPLKKKQQIELLKMTSKRDVGDFQSLFMKFKHNRSDDILSNPLHLTMIAQLEELFSGNDCQNLFDIYEKIVTKKVHDMLVLDYVKGSNVYQENWENCESELQNISLSYLNNMSVKDLQYTRNGIVTLIDKKVVFVHQTFAEFLVAQSYIDCLKEQKCKIDEMPFDLLEHKYQQVRKFVEMKISKSQDEEAPILKSSLKFVLSENLTRENIVEVLIHENLSTMFSLFENRITFGKNGAKVKFHFENTHDILKEACWKSEEIALKLLDLGAFESLEFQKIEKITDILEGAIQNNFVRVISALLIKCSAHSSIDEYQANGNVGWKAPHKNHHEMLVFQRELFGALQTAVDHNSVECVKLLIQHGFPTACLNFDRYKNVYMEIGTARALLGTKSEKPEKLAPRLFQRAIVGTSVEAAKFLQKECRGGIEKLVFYDGKTALHVVAVINEMSKHSAALEMCQWLVEECDFKIGDKDDKGWNALHYAVVGGNLELVKYFLEKDPTLIKSVIDDTQGQNLLHCAVNWRRKAMIEYLYGRDGDLIKQITKEGETALHLAAKEGYLDECVWLVENGVDLDAEDDKGWNAVHCAAKNWIGKGGKILMYLHKEKPELIEQKTSDGETVLHLACTSDKIDLETIEWLLAQGLDPSDKNRKGWNALHIAASEGGIGKIKFIHEKYPGLIESVTNDGENAMHLMASNICDVGGLKVLHALCGKLVKQKTKTNKTVLHCAAQLSDEKVFKWLVEEIELDIKSEDNKGWNVVHFTANNDYSYVSEILEFIKTKNSGLIVKTTKRNETALHIAAMKGNYDQKFKWLLQNGVDPVVKNVDGKTAWQVWHDRKILKV
ncbi:uncharacterized protein LOC132194836 [Neocloeon triangulifer]|uniref:uncharacterized protein LOC132194836 n=1 Tax=Neocloeon triangulifer TaxID=2078957 RepID=UPI00286EEE14|nr:uncharacterized protein LOC132194836 [Neocloeon triangulifer]